MAKYVQAFADQQFERYNDLGSFGNPTVVRKSEIVRNSEGANNLDDIQGRLPISENRNIVKKMLQPVIENDGLHSPLDFVDELVKASSSIDGEVERFRKGLQLDIHTNIPNKKLIIYPFDNNKAMSILLNPLTQQYLFSYNIDKQIVTFDSSDFEVSFDDLKMKPQLKIKNNVPELEALLKEFFVHTDPLSNIDASGKDKVGFEGLELTSNTPISDKERAELASRELKDMISAFTQMKSTIDQVEYDSFALPHPFDKSKKVIFDMNENFNVTAVKVRPILLRLRELNDSAFKPMVSIY
ncbi:MAG: hypothetical protein HRT47_03920 [Candidatus Caenarcaniphilales bacterium]|nr:hypothetical protein [Candidatus Caenarcaniphilales bacterium]